MTDYDLPPQSIDAEQGLLGCLLTANEAWDKIADVLSAADFYREEHRRIYETITRMVQAGKPADIITVSEALKDTDIGFSYIADLANGQGSSVFARRYAEIIADKARLRLMQAILNDSIAECFTAGAKSQQALDTALGRLFEMADNGRSSEEPRLVSEILPEVVGKIQDRYENKGQISGLATGFEDLDELTGGLQPADLIIIGGRPSMGKTAIAINIAENVALNGKTVLVFSIEMPDQALVARSISSVGKVRSKNMRDGRMDQSEWEGLSSAVGRLNGVQMYIDQSSSITVPQMHAKARRLKRKSKTLDLIVIDYLQLVTSSRVIESKNNEVSEMSRAMKLMAKDLKVPVICLSQLNRKPDDRADKRPVMSDLRDSGSIEQDADLVAFMYRDEYYNKDSPLKGYGEMLIRKHRNGECGEIPLVFEGEYSRFKSASKSEYYAAVSRCDAPKTSKFRGE